MKKIALLFTLLFTFSIFAQEKEIKYQGISIKNYDKEGNTQELTSGQNQAIGSIMYVTEFDDIVKIGDDPHDSYTEIYNKIDSSLFIRRYERIEEDTLPPREFEYTLTITSYPMMKNEIKIVRKEYYTRGSKRFHSSTTIIAKEI